MSGDNSGRWGGVGWGGVGWGGVGGGGGGGGERREVEEREGGVSGRGEVGTTPPHLGNVVRHIVDHVHVQLVRCLAELLRERLPGQEGHAAPVHPGVVSRSCHRRQVVLPLG